MVLLLLVLLYCLCRDVPTVVLCLIGGFGHYRLIVYLVRYTIYVRKGGGGKGRTRGESVGMFCFLVFLVDVLVRVLVQRRCTRFYWSLFCMNY